MFSEGQSVSEVCAELGIWKDTFYAWVKKYPRFSDAYQRGLDLSQAWWERLGRGGASGTLDIQPTTWIFNMKNRFKWTDRMENEIAGGLQLVKVTEKEAEGLD
jgi:transposase